MFLICFDLFSKSDETRTVAPTDKQSGSSLQDSTKGNCLSASSVTAHPFIIIIVVIYRCCYLRGGTRAGIFFPLFFSFLPCGLLSHDPSTSFLVFIAKLLGAIRVVHRNKKDLFFPPLPLVPANVAFWLFFVF